MQAMAAMDKTVLARFLFVLADICPESLLEKMVFISGSLRLSKRTGTPW
jgi:hypothetical protein